MRREFEMTDDQLAAIMDASKPVPAMSDWQGNYLFGTPQENANRAWRELADELGFIWDSVQPIAGKHSRFFSAEAVDNAPPLDGC